MKTEGLILLIVSWSIIICMLIFCYSKVFAGVPSAKKKAIQNKKKKRLKK